MRPYMDGVIMVHHSESDIEVQYLNNITKYHTQDDENESSILIRFYIFLPHKIVVVIFRSCI